MVENEKLEFDLLKKKDEIRQLGGHQKMGIFRVTLCRLLTSMS